MTREEQIARIIDPNAWRISTLTREQDRKIALAKARQIAALYEQDGDWERSYSFTVETELDTVSEAADTLEALSERLIEVGAERNKFESMWISSEVARQEAVALLARAGDALEPFASAWNRCAPLGDVYRLNLSQLTSPDDYEALASLLAEIRGTQAAGVEGE